MLNAVMIEQVLTIDKLLKHRRKYMGEVFHRIMIKKQHPIFVKAKYRIVRAEKKRNERLNQKKVRG